MNDTIALIENAVWEQRGYELDRETDIQDIDGGILVTVQLSSHREEQIEAECDSLEALFADSGLEFDLYDGIGDVAIYQFA